MPDRKDETEILRAVIGGHQVTMTHRKAGTMQVSKTAYRHFRKIIVEREILDWESTQSDVLAELGASIDHAVWLRQRDRRGNMMLLDRETGIMFIIEAEARVLRCVYDQRQNKLEKKKAKRQARQAAPLAA